MVGLTRGFCGFPKSIFEKGKKQGGRKGGTTGGRIEVLCTSGGCLVKQETRVENNTSFVLPSLPPFLPPYLATLSLVRRGESRSAGARDI